MGGQHAIFFPHPNSVKFSLKTNLKSLGITGCLQTVGLYKSTHRRVFVAIVNVLDICVYKCSNKSDK